MIGKDILKKFQQGYKKKYLIVQDSQTYQKFKITTKNYFRIKTFATVN